MIWVSLEVQGTPKGTGCLGNPVFTQNARTNSAEIRAGGLRERKSCVGKKISVLWLLFEAVLAAPKQTVGLGKNTPQTGREAAEKFSWQLLTAGRPQPSSSSQASAHRKPQARPGEDPAAGKGECALQEVGSGGPGLGLTSV